MFLGWFGFGFVVQDQSNEQKIKHITLANTQKPQSKKKKWHSYNNIN